MSRRVHDAAPGVSLDQTAGGNSKYSNESFQELMIM